MAGYVHTDGKLYPVKDDCWLISKGDQYVTIDIPVESLRCPAYGCDGIPYSGRQALLKHIKAKHPYVLVRQKKRGPAKVGTREAVLAKKKARNDSEAGRKSRALYRERHLKARVEASMQTATLPKLAQRWRRFLQSTAQTAYTKSALFNEFPEFVKTSLEQPPEIPPYLGAVPDQQSNEITKIRVMVAALKAKQEAGSSQDNAIQENSGDNTSPEEIDGDVDTSDELSAGPNGGNSSQYEA